MSDFQGAVQIIAKQEDKFMQLVESAKTDVMFKNELLFASQSMMNNDYLCKVALSNPLSLRNAFSQIAACGLTLNPARGFAYLVPRDGQVILDVSYRGMVKAAVNDGAIRDCIVELVYSKDDFKYRGKRQSPTHAFNPFDKKADRGEFIGAYVEALLPDGRVHVEAIPAEDIYAAREASDLWKRKKKGPWVDFFTSMAKKTAIKIARKYWPQTSAKLDELVQYLNTNAGEGFASNDVPVSVVERYMGQVEQVEPAHPLPTSNVATPEAQPVAEAQQAPVTQPQATAQSNAQAPLEGTVEPPAVVAESDIPKSTLNKVEELVKRARNSGAWKAAHEYISTWPVPARDYATNKLKAAEYQLANSGE